MKVEVDRKRRIVVINVKKDEKMTFEKFFKTVADASLKIAQSHVA